jgi:hypothetical protein
MHVLRSQFTQYTLAGLLVAFLVWRGIIPAFSHLDSDFPNYYTAAKLVAEGRDVRHLYDDSWFQDQIHSYGMNQLGKFSPFPPATALIFLPLTSLEPLDALRISAVINIGLLVLSIRFLSLILQVPLTGATIFVLLAGIGLANCFRLGQLYILLSFLVIAGYYAYGLGRTTLAGICWGLFVPIKYFPIVILAYFVFRREWKVVIAGVCTATLVALMGLLVLGWDVHREFISSVLGNHLASHFSSQNPFSAAFQSWDSLLRRLFVYDPDMNPQPLFAGVELFLPLKIAILLLQLVAALVALVHVHHLRSANADAFSIGLLGLTALLLAPGTGTYHYVLLWLPVGLLLVFFLGRGQTRTAFALAGTYAALGFIPYGAVRHFDGDGLLTVLAYPRLALLLVMFLLTTFSAWNRTATGNVEE